MPATISSNLPVTTQPATGSPQPVLAVNGQAASPRVRRGRAPLAPVVPLPTGPAAQVRFLGFWSPMQNGAGRVVFPWSKPGDTIPFEARLEVQGDATRVHPEVYTNANHNDDPSQFDAYPMVPVRTEGNVVTYRAEVPVDAVGNYRATARVTVDGANDAQWLGAPGAADIRFRPHAVEHDALNMMEVNILSVNGGHGTLADLASAGTPQSTGKYTLEHLKRLGFNAVWIQPPTERSVWQHRHPLDDAGSPYAAKDFFQVDPEYSERAKQLRDQGASQADQERAANEEFRAFVAKAHALGMKVIVDLALNHVGHNYEFEDLFTRYDAAGNEIRQVLQNDFTQVEVNPQQAAVVNARLADPNLPRYMEYVAPFMYASNSGDGSGAQGPSDIMPGGGQWFDTKQLFTGGSYGPKNPEQNERVVDYLGRVLEYWSVDMGVDGFRLDHLTGLPQTVLEDALNHAQAEVDQHRPGTQLYFTGEDFFSAEYNAPFLDNIQDTWLRNSLMASMTPGTLRGLLQNPYFDHREMINLTSHDETRFDYGGNTWAQARMQSLLPLVGGTSMMTAGDEYGEWYPLPFKQYRAVESIRNLNPTSEGIADAVGRAGRARLAEPALQSALRGWPWPRDGAEDPDLFAVSRVPQGGAVGDPVLVFASFSNGQWRENTFRLDNDVRSLIDPNRRYQVRDLMGDGQPMWRAPLTGRQLLDDGVFVRLAPNQVQALKLELVP